MRGHLKIEVQQSTGQPSHPESQPDEDLKMLAITGLMNSDPQRAMPLLEKVLNGPGTPKEKSKALFVLAQNGSPQSREILARIASGQSNPDLQRKAVEYLGMFGGQESRQTLATIYASTSDVSVKRAILRSYMIGGDKEHLFAAAKSEKDASLRAEAIRQLGIVHAPEELRQLYATETSARSEKGHPAGILPLRRCKIPGRSSARRKGPGDSPHGDSQSRTDRFGGGQSRLCWRSTPRKPTARTRKPYSTRFSFKATRTLW